MQERRKYPRISISFPVECNLLPASSYFYTVCKDLSLGGLKILSEKFIPKDKLLKINIDLIDRVVNTKARVAWCNHTPASERYTAGLDFVEIGKQDQGAISQFLSEVHPF